MNNEGSDSHGREHDPELDQAESAEAPAPARLTCVACGRPIDQLYYEINGQAHCDTCCGKIEVARLGGSRVARVARATSLGAVGGALGAAIYYAVAALTGYEIGLVALLVGLLVGGAVRWGSNARGGWFYQCLAMFLTYAAIGVSYGLFMVQAVAEDPSLLDPNTATLTTAAPTSTREAGASPPADGRPTEAPGESSEDLRTGAVLAGVGMALALIAFVVLALPIVAGIEAPIGLLILGIALYEAWKINKRQHLEITGPYALGNGSADQTGTAAPGESRG